jgi:uroporphyrinogen-III synthase
MTAASESALGDWTVITTRPVGRGAGLARALRAIGASVHALPCASLRVCADHERARRELAASTRVDAVVFTSPSAVRYAYMLRAGLRWPRSIAVFAVGAATARALRRRGVMARVPERYDSEGVLAHPELSAVRGKKIAIVTAPMGRELLADRLRARGARVAKVFVYERVAPRWSHRHLAPLSALTARSMLVVSSVAAIDMLVARLAAPMLTRLKRSILVASSTRVADAARAAGWRKTHLARSALPRDLCAACVSASKL